MSYELTWQLLGRRIRFLASFQLRYSVRKLLHKLCNGRCEDCAHAHSACLLAGACRPTLASCALLTTLQSLPLPDSVEGFQGLSRVQFAQLAPLFATLLALLVVMLKGLTPLPAVKKPAPACVPHLCSQPTKVLRWSRPPVCQAH